MKEVHERNNKKIKEIIGEYGWLLESEVGDDDSDAAWLIVQHAILDQNFQEYCIPLLEFAVNNGEAKGWQLAYLQDRVLIQKGKPQIYGTQHELKDGKVVPKPTLEPKKVNEKRFHLGIWTQEEHTEFLQKDYNTNQEAKQQHETRG